MTDDLQEQLNRAMSDGPGTADVMAVIGKYENKGRTLADDDRCEFTPVRNQSCPRCKCNVVWAEPSEVTKCYVCDFSGEWGKSK
jgi:hypothetical protein